MTIKKLINSDRTFAEAVQILRDAYQQHRYLRMSLIEGLHRSLDQNSMNFELYIHIGDQLYGGDHQHARNECKLDVGIPILCRDDDAFHEVWSRTLAPHPREVQLAAMLMIQVTSLMTRKQNVEYINRVLDTYTVQGVEWPSYLTERARAFGRRAA